MQLPVKWLIGRYYLKTKLIFAVCKKRNNEEKSFSKHVIKMETRRGIKEIKSENIKKENGNF